MKEMISMQRREPYKDNRIMSYKELKDFFIPELELKYSKGSETPKVTEEYNNYRVWLLFAKFEDFASFQSVSWTLTQSCLISV